VQVPQLWMTLQSSAKAPQLKPSVWQLVVAVHPQTFGRPPPPQLCGGVHWASVQQPLFGMQNEPQHCSVLESQHVSPQTVVPPGQHKPRSVQAPSQQPSISQQRWASSGQHLPSQTILGRMQQSSSP
jgi:hypothetical protein